MVCLHCGSKTQVVNSRLRRRTNRVWRRRQCQQCRAIFTTEETPQLQNAWLVSSNDSYRPFLPEKLLLSLYRSLQHRPNAAEDAASLSRTIISKLGPQVKDGLMPASAISHVAQIALNRFDKAASTNYAAYHRPR